jgi:hypothetical protein
VLFVADRAGCALQAPLALAWLRKNQAHVLSGAIACSEPTDGAAIQSNPVLVRLLDDFGLPAQPAAAAAVGSGPAVRSLEQVLRLPGATAPSVIVSLDDASRAAADAAASGTSSRRIHQPLVLEAVPVAAAAASAAGEEQEDAQDALAKRIKEFITDLPELIAML